MPAKKTASKADFVRSLPSTTPASEVVKKASAAGVKLTTAYVYVIRSQSRKKAGKPAAAKPAAKVHHKTRGAAKAVHHTVGSHKAEDLLRAVAAELGLANAMAILKTEHDRVHRLIANN